MKKPARVIRYCGRVLFYVRTMPSTIGDRHDYNRSGKEDVRDKSVMFYNEIGETVEYGYESLDAEIEANAARLDELRFEAVWVPEKVVEPKKQQGLSPETIERMRAMRRSGETVSAIALALSVSAPSVRKYTKDIERPPSKKVVLHPQTRAARKKKIDAIVAARDAELDEEIERRRKERDDYHANLRNSIKVFE